MLSRLKSLPLSRWSLIVGIILVLLAILLSVYRTPKPDTPEQYTYTDIAMSYHGVLLDKELNEITLDKAAIEHIEDSMIASLTAVDSLLGEVDWKPPLVQAEVDQILTGFDFTEDERILTKLGIIQQGIEAALPDERAAYQPPFDFIAERLPGLVNDSVLEWRPLYERYLISIKFSEVIRWIIDNRMIFNPTTQYMDSCRANSVPIPPDWPTGGWTNQGALPVQYNFLASGANTQVWTYQPPANAGICYALPRMTGNSVSLLGIICQSQTTGKACFWDNIDAATGNRIMGVGITLTIAELKDGSNLAENCTMCHRGYNAFIIHPNTPLGIPTNRNPNVRYTPMGQSTWSNPPPLAAQGSGACASCHEIGAASSGFCSILSTAGRLTMPSHTAPAGWPAASSSPYAAHIATLRMACP
jgi:hypothetical protein